MPQQQKPSKPATRKTQQLIVRGDSCKPGVRLMERIAFQALPLDEDLATLDAWRPVLCLPITTITEATI